MFPPLSSPDDDAGNDQQLLVRENFRRLRKRKGTSEQEREKLAVETALLVNDEVKRMKASIAELERVLLLSQQGHGDDAESVEEIAVPPVILVEEEEEDGPAELFVVDVPTNTPPKEASASTAAFTASS